MLEFQDRLGYKFKNEQLLKKALTHKSCTKNKQDSNERLEFLGDAVLELVVTEYMVLKYKGIDEGKLSKIRAASVNTKTLSLISKNLEVYKYLSVGPSERKEGIVHNNSILEDTFEALIGAVYLDGGFENAKKVISKHLFYMIDKTTREDKIIDHKTYLQEFTQKHFACLPTYKIIKEEGEEHNKIFYCEVFIELKSYGIGIGKSKKEAEKEAAKKAIKCLVKNNV